MKPLTRRPLPGNPVLLALAAAAFLVSAPAHAGSHVFRVTLTGAQEVPPVTTLGSATATVYLNDVSGLVHVDGSYAGMSANVNGAHLHGLAAPGVNAGILVPLAHTGGMSGTISGSGVLTPAQIAGLLGGQTYLNVHTTANINGEVRGQVRRIHTFDITADGVQEVPPNASAGTASIRVIVDDVTGAFNLSGTYTGIPSGVISAHIHSGAAGVGGGILVPLVVTGGTSGNVSGSGTLTPANLALLLAGGTYVNIHSNAFTLGEIRAQIQPVGSERYCLNAGPTNTVVLSGVGPARLGTVFTAQATNVTGIVTSFSLSLGPADFPLLGGTALVDPFQLVKTVLRGVNLGTSNWNLGIPTDPSLAGIALYFQSTSLVTISPDTFEFSNGLQTVLSP